MVGLPVGVPLTPTNGYPPKKDRPKPSNPWYGSRKPCFLQPPFLQPLLNKLNTYKRANSSKVNVLFVWCACVCVCPEHYTPEHCLVDGGVFFLVEKAMFQMGKMEIF